MAKKIILSVLFSVMLIGSFAITTNASDFTYYAPYSEPSYGDNGGYIGVLINNDYGGQSFYTIVWNMYPYDETKCAMDITVNEKNVTLTGLGGQYDVNVMEWNYAGGMYVVNSLSNEGNSFYRRFSYNGSIAGVTYKGNTGTITSNIGNYLNLVSVVWDAENQTLQRLTLVYEQLYQANRNDVTMMQYLNDIMNSNRTSSEKLALLNEKQEETNTWLEKIFNWLNESKEQEKQEVQTQGSNSVTQGSDSIENSGQGFGDSLGGLVSSMSYSGTECKWTFPEVRMPAIKGVIKETVLIEEQPIDFGVWIDAIPSNIILLIRSVLTGALIIYCFKELYGTISYVLTLKGSGVNE